MKYEDDNRGKIQFKDRKRQIIDFSGIKYDKITPTDLDGLIERHDEKYVLYEFKLSNAKIPSGQYKALIHLADTIERGQRDCLLIIARHEQHNPKLDIDAANAIVVKYYYKGKWYYNINKTVKKVTDNFLGLS